MAKRLLTAVLVCTALTFVGCGTETQDGPASSDNGAADQIIVSGSATVKSITETLANRGDFDVQVSADGTADGFERFCKGESDINNASVEIPGEGESTDYQKLCSDNGVDYVELPIALDGVTIVKNDQNTWATDLTMDQLKQIWSKDSSVSKWSDLNPDWPDDEIVLYGRPEGSGTLSYFSTAVVGDGEMRDDFQTTDDIDELSGWIADDVNGIGFMGIGNYLATTGEIRDNIDNVTVDGIAPSREETQSGNYPLSRKLYIYVSKESLEDKANVKDFAKYYLDNVKDVLPRVYFFALPDEEYEKAREQI